MNSGIVPIKATTPEFFKNTLSIRTRALKFYFS